MTVYVDDMHATEPNSRWPYKASCHMMADTSLELDDMAESLGLRPRAKQHPFEPNEHYDLTTSKRREAIRLGAVPIPWRKMVELVRRKKEVAREQPQPLQS